MTPAVSPALRRARRTSATASTQRHQDQCLTRTAQQRQTLCTGCACSFLLKLYTKRNEARHLRLINIVSPPVHWGPAGQQIRARYDRSEPVVVTVVTVNVTPLSVSEAVQCFQVMHGGGQSTSLQALCQQHFWSIQSALLQQVFLSVAKTHVVKSQPLSHLAICLLCKPGWKCQVVYKDAWASGLHLCS